MPHKYMLSILYGRLFALKFLIRSCVWKDADVASVPSPPMVVVSGFFNEALGIGRAAKLAANNIEQAAIPVLREDLRPFDRGLLTRAPALFSEGRRSSIWLINANPPETRIALYTHKYEDWKDLYRIGYSAWESTIAPRSWVSTARWLHEIWVPSQFVADALSATFTAAGKKQYMDKLRVMPHPIDIPGPCKKATQDHIRALMVFDPRSDFERKNPVGAIDAWLMAFPNPLSKAELVIKSHAAAVSHPVYQDLVTRIKGRTDIFLQAETLTDIETAALISSSDILISLHRGEGFGLPIAEAMASGLSVIATGWSGNMQFMTAENSIPVPYELVPANRSYNGPEAQWAEPDIPAAARALQQLVSDTALRDRLGRQAIADIRRMNLSWAPENLFHRPLTNHETLR